MLGGSEVLISMSTRGRSFPGRLDFLRDLPCGDSNMLLCSLIVFLVLKKKNYLFNPNRLLG